MTGVQTCALPIYFNRALAPYGIAARRGWEALNFFYNTRMDGHDMIVADEAWSRPGDYVLLRALTDLVCVSSACPDDIDPGNGWEPTDIHVRTYAATETFSRAVAYRMTPDSDPQLTRETAFHPRLSAMTRDLCEVIDPAALPSNAGPGARVAFHSPCSLQHGQKLRGRVERLLERCGYALTPVAEEIGRAHV